MTDPESPPTAVEATEDIYFNDFGDVILLVGKYRIHVASVILGTASVVFKAMFSPKFQEGYELHKAAEDRVTVISLPEDNAEAVLTLCRIVHFDNAVLNRCIPTLAALDDLVMVCDKYDCSQAVHFVSKDWMALYVHDAGLPGHENLLILSYLFNLPEAFCTISSTLFEKYNGPFEKIIMDRGRDVLPMRIWVATETKRNEVKGMIEVALSQILTQLQIPPFANTASKEHKKCAAFKPATT